MAHRGQVWFYESSPAAELVKALSNLYALVPVRSSSAGVSSPPVQDATGLPAGAEGAGLPASGGPVVCVADVAADDAAALRRLAGDGGKLRLIALVANGAPDPSAAPDAGDAQVFAYVASGLPPALFEKTVSAAFENIELAERERAAREELERAEREMEELNKIGVALSSQRDIHTLLELILAKAREITGADAGSLYLVEETTEGQRKLRFKLTQNDSLSLPFKDFVMPMTETSMAGYVALHGEVINLPDAYLIPSDRPYKFNPKFDRDSGYRTRSMLTLPMNNAKGEVLGVLQLLNRKRNPAARLTGPEVVEREVIDFSERAARLALSLASQAAVAYENNKLYQDIETLFEGFVAASVKAIEQRDPTTSGHSFRVSKLTVGLAEVVDKVDTGPYSGVRFTREQMKEIRYAAVLHDFGKVGVREEVLVKAKKLYPMQLAMVQQRFDYVRKELEARITKQKLDYLLQKSREEALAQVQLLDQEYERRLAEVDDFFQFVLQVNEPTVLPEGQFDRLIEIARNTYVDPRGIEHNLLNPDEVRLLSIPKGSLDPEERSQIESHVLHTFNFLTQIPWTREIRDIPTIARAHHEKLNGTGYPHKLSSDQIPLQAKMMTISDIFDALSASDRPYKKAVPVEKALKILEMSVRDNEIDPDLFRLFFEAKIYELTVKRT